VISPVVRAPGSLAPYILIILPIPLPQMVLDGGVMYSSPLPFRASSPPPVSHPHRTQPIIIYMHFPLLSSSSFLGVDSTSELKYGMFGFLTLP
jgi:hypothetical protein